MIAKGQTAPLLYTQRARHRIMVGISWDARAKKTTIIDRIVGTDQQHDLDLSCFVFDKDGTYIDFIGSMAQDAMDSTGSIYHSGDDDTGAGSGDDESVSCELIGLPETTRHLVFVTEIRSDHVFSQVDEPCYRLVDGTTDKTLFEQTITEQGSRDKAAWVMLRIYRDSASPTGWSVHMIDEYPPLSDVPDWAAYLSRYL